VGKSDFGGRKPTPIGAILKIEHKDPVLKRELLKLRRLCSSLKSAINTKAAEPTVTEGDWIRVIGDSQAAMYAAALWLVVAIVLATFGRRLTLQDGEARASRG